MKPIRNHLENHLFLAEDRESLEAERAHWERHLREVEERHQKEEEERVKREEEEREREAVQGERGVL